MAIRKTKIIITAPNAPLPAGAGLGAPSCANNVGKNADDAKVVATVISFVPRTNGVASSPIDPNAEPKRTILVYQSIIINPLAKVDKGAARQITSIFPKKPLLSIKSSPPQLKRGGNRGKN